VIIVNGTMIVRSFLYPDELPDFIGYKPLIVLSGSMEPTMEAGDLALVRKTPAEKIAKDDVIAFRLDKSTETAIIHRVTEVVSENGEMTFFTKGDANTGTDEEPVKAENLEGRYLGKIAKLGHFALFLQTPMGMLLFVIIPLALLLGYDVIFRSKDKSAREVELEAQLAELKQEQKKAKDHKEDKTK
ncbi:MAG TPA: signal peptidase I, partial [Clostridia bacterium]|nr:signal peptidase I [Clostridia bacterium]